MSLAIPKILLSTFILFTLSSTILLSYTAYLWLDVNRAVRMIYISVQSFNITISNAQASATHVLIVENPSEYTFGVISLREELSLNGTRMGQKVFPPSREPYIEIIPFSSVDVTIKVVIERNDVLIPELFRGYWSVQGFILLHSPLPTRFELPFGDVIYK